MVTLMRIVIVIVNLRLRLLGSLRLARSEGIRGLRRHRAGSGRKRVARRFRRQSRCTGAWSRYGAADGLSGRLRFANTPQFRFAFQIAHMALERGAQFAGGAPEFAHDFAEIARQFGQLLGSEDHESHCENNNQVWDTKHGVSGTKTGQEFGFLTASSAPFLNHRRGPEACQTAENLYAIIAFLGLSEDAWNLRGHLGAES